MDIIEFQRQFQAVFRKNGLEALCSEQIIQRFASFTELFLQVNAHTNLSAIREIPDIIAKHYADCLLAEPYFPQSAAVLDVGCGGGFPCIPLTIARPDLQITAVDSTAKKIAFVQAAASSQGMHNLNPICARIEDRALSKFKERFTIGTSRAVARLSVLAELILPYIQVGGQLIALKGANCAVEIAEAEPALQKLGAIVEADHSKQLFCGGHAEERHILIIRKVVATSTIYPRQYATILKKPL